MLPIDPPLTDSALDSASGPSAVHHGADCGRHPMPPTWSRLFPKSPSPGGYGCQAPCLCSGPPSNPMPPGRDPAFAILAQETAYTSLLCEFPNITSPTLSPGPCTWRLPPHSCSQPHCTELSPMLTPGEARHLPVRLCAPTESWDRPAVSQQVSIPTPHGHQGQWRMAPMWVLPPSEPGLHAGPIYHPAPPRPLGWQGHGYSQKSTSPGGTTRSLFTPRTCPRWP